MFSKQLQNFERSSASLLRINGVHDPQALGRQRDATKHQHRWSFSEVGELTKIGGRVLLVAGARVLHLLADPIARL